MGKVVLEAKRRKAKQGKVLKSLTEVFEDLT